MKALKIILFSIYPILIALLLLFNLNHGKSSSGSQEDSTILDTVRMDTSNIVREAERVGNQGAVVVFQEGKAPQTYPVYMSQIKEVKDVTTIQIQ